MWPVQAWTKIVVTHWRAAISVEEKNSLCFSAAKLHCQDLSAATKQLFSHFKRLPKRCSPLGRCLDAKRTGSWTEADLEQENWLLERLSECAATCAARQCTFFC